jgi:hypothetical protein
MVTLRKISGMALGMNSRWTHEVVITTGLCKVVYPCDLAFGNKLVDRLEELKLVNCDSLQLQKIVKELKEV